MKKKMKWIIVSLAGVIAVSGIAGGFIAKSWLGKVLTRESFVRQIESQWNCRADLAELTVSLWATPAHVELKGLVLSRRDADADGGTPVAGRKPIQASAALAGADHLELEVDLTELIHHRLHVKRLTLTNLRLRNDVSEENGSLLAELFRKPRSMVAAEPGPSAKLTPSASLPAATPDSTPVMTAAPAVLPDPAPASAASTDTTVVAQKPAHHPIFQASELGLSVVIDEARIEQGSFHENNHLSHTRTDVSDLKLAISQVDFDPSDLLHHNQCKIVLAARVGLKGRGKVGNDMQDVKIADLTFETNSTIEPLDAATGELNPSGTLDLLLKKGSIFWGTQTFGDLFGKDKNFSQMKRNFGIDVSNVIAGGEIQQDMHTVVKISGPHLEFTEDAQFLFPDYSVSLRKGGWLDNGTADAIDMTFQLLPSDRLGKELLDGARTKMGDGLVGGAQQFFNDGNGHLAFDFTATGNLSKPKYGLGGQMGALLNMFKGGGLLKGLIK